MCWMMCFLLRIIKAKHIQLLKLAIIQPVAMMPLTKSLFLMIQKICKSKILGSIWMQDRKMGCIILLHDASMDSSMSEAILSNVLRPGKDLEAHVSHIILHMLHQTMKPSFLRCETALTDTY